MKYRPNWNTFGARRLSIGPQPETYMNHYLLFGIATVTSVAIAAMILTLFVSSSLTDELDG
jgi:hypothetical protein